MRLNQITITGNVGKEPKVIEKNNETIAYLSLCHQAAENKAEWYTVIAFNELAQKVKQIKKGAFIIVSGSLNSYQPNAEIKNQTIIQIVARQIGLADHLKRTPQIEDANAELSEVIPT